MKRGGISWLAAAIAALVGFWVYARLAATPVPRELVQLLGRHAGALLELDTTELVLRAGPAQRAAVEAWLSGSELEGAITDVGDERVSVTIADDHHAFARSPRGLSGDPLRFHIVLDGTPWAAALARYVQGDPAAAAAGIEAVPDTWMNEDSDTTHSDYHLVGPSREALERYFTHHGDLGVAPPPRAVILLERVVPRSAEGRPRPAIWRSYVVDGRVELGSADVASADVFWDPTTNLPEVLITFTADGARRFAELTTRNVGRKLAIVVDGEVSSAPVIRSSITGGRSNITMGEDDPRAAQQAAEALVTALRAPALPDGVELLEKRPLPPGGGPWRLLVAVACGLLALAIAVVGARWVPIAAAPRPMPAPAGGAFPWGRLLLTAAAVAAVGFAPRLLLPSVDRTVLDAIALAGGDPALVSCFALGLQPFATSFVLVELLALARPGLRRLRLGDAAARARLDAGAVALGLFFALLQGYFVAGWLQRLASAGDELALLPLVTDTASLAAGSALLLVVAALINRFGLGNGFLLVPAATSNLWAARIDDGERLLAAATTALLAVGTIWILHRSVAGRRLPTCGAVPLAYAAPFWTVVGLFATMHVAPPGWLQSLSPQDWPRFAELSAIATIGAAFAVAFSRRGPGLTAAAAVSVTYVVLLDAQQIAFRDSFFIGGLMGAAFVAGAVDVVADVRARLRARDLVELRPLQRIDDATDVAAALAAAGIPCHLRNLAARTLFHFFAPQLPVLVMVPRARAEEAAAVVETALQA